MIVLLCSSGTGWDPVSKLDDIYIVGTEKFSSIWKPGKNVCINEGKVHFKVYNPDKPYKYGVTSYQLCDSSNGCNQGMFEIYTGVDPNPPSAKGKTNVLVMRPMEQYLNVC